MKQKRIRENISVNSSSNISGTSQKRGVKTKNYGSGGKHTYFNDLKLPKSKR